MTPGRLVVYAALFGLLSLPVAPGALATPASPLGASADRQGKSLLHDVQRGGGGAARGGGRMMGGGGGSGGPAVRGGGMRGPGPTWGMGRAGGGPRLGMGPRAGGERAFRTPGPGPGPRMGADRGPRPGGPRVGGWVGRRDGRFAGRRNWDGRHDGRYRRYWRRGVVVGAPWFWWGDDYWYPYNGYSGRAAAGGYAEADARCRARFRSYDPATGTFLSNDGTRRRCPYLP